MWGATASTAHRNVYLLVRFAVILMIREILNVPKFTMAVYYCP